MKNSIPTNIRKEFNTYSWNVLIGKEKVPTPVRIRYFLFCWLIPVVALGSWLIDVENSKK